ncbi:MAG: acylphosphatase [Candidatus Babeliales bacterium]
MSQCLHITFLVKNKNFLQDVVQKKARQLGIEGVVQGLNAPESQVKMIACGTRDALDQLVDALHQGVGKNHISDMAIEPTLKERDFRGVFRVIE